MHDNALLRNLVALACGLLFGAGLYVSGMADPGKVLGFLDLPGGWNPALIGVLGGAVVVSLFGFQSVPRLMRRPWFEARFHTPTRTQIDRPLIFGALLFGVGWGLVGYCPGPALAGLGLGNGEAPAFVLAMLAGGLLHKFWTQRKS